MASTVHLESADRLEGVGEVLDLRCGGVGGPANDENIEPALRVAQAVAMDVVHGRARHAPLLALIDRKCRSFRICPGRRPHLGEDKAARVERDNVELPAGAEVIELKDAIAEMSKVLSRRALRASAEPASPPGPASKGGDGHL